MYACVKNSFVVGGSEQGEAQLGALVRRASRAFDSGRHGEQGASQTAKGRGRSEETTCTCKYFFVL